MVARDFNPWRRGNANSIFPPGGRTMVARDFQSLESVVPHIRFPPGGQAMLQTRDPPALRAEEKEKRKWVSLSFTRG